MRLEPLTLVLLLAGTPLSAQVYPTVGSLQDPEMKALRRAMIAGEDLGKLSLRRLADAGDGLAAFRFADRLAQDGGTWSDIAHYYAIALYTGRDFVAPRLVSLIKAHDSDIAALSGLRRKSLEDALLVAAARDNRDAALALSEMYLDGAAFGVNEDKAARLLTPYATAGDGAAALKIALIAIGSDPAKPNDPEAARAMLTLAVSGNDLAAASMAKNLLPLLPAEPEPEGATP